MKQYLFVLGRTPKLALVELEAIASSVSSLRSDILLASCELEPVQLMQMLGGTVKVCEVAFTGSTPTLTDIRTILLEEVKNNVLVFGISTYAVHSPFTTKMLFTLKEELVEQGVRTRFIESKHDSPLSSVVIAKQKVTELIVVQTSDTSWYVGVTRAVQDFEQWNTRDFGKPFSDPKHGMLPPKVARMIVNIAKSALTKTMGGIKTPILLDPFCGTGTILVEALTVGCLPIGADISEQAIEKSRKNVAWARARFALKPEAINVFACDATHVSDVVKSPVHAIVTEPYMGNTNASDFGRVIEYEKAKNIIKGLEKLYIGCLREWSKILVTGGIIVMALPQYALGKETLFVKKVIDRCEILGYTHLDGPIEYGRPDAVVRREFYIFQKN